MNDTAQHSPQPNPVTVEASRIIDAPVERLWAEVANFNNVAAWHPDVTESQLERVDVEANSSKPGDIRVIKLRDGTVLRERLVEIRPETHHYVYSVLDGQLPLKEHISSVTMRVVDAHHTEVTWMATFVPVGAPPNVLAEGVRSGVIELGLRGLADRVRKT
jgi:uncharacterized protein YndB with AHSA1/START domain